MTVPRRLVLSALALLLPSLAQAAPAPSGIEQARAALEATRAAYRQAGAFRETFDFELELPDGRREPRKHEYGVGKDGKAFMVLSSGGKENLRIVARDRRIVATERHVAGRYAEVAYQGDFGDSLRRMGGEQAQLTAPPAIVAGQGGDFDDFLSALRFGILAPLEIVGFQPSPLQVTLRAANGQVTLGLDPSTHRLREAHLALGEGKQQVRASGRFLFTAGDPGSALNLPDLAGRTAVPTLAALEASSYPLGQPAPQVAVRDLDGGTVRPGDLKGSVVVLDFWATWCVPCWTALGHTAELAAWAKSSGLPVKVFALDTLENTKDPAEQRRLALELLRSRKLELPVLLDQGNEAFAAFHNPGLPSLVIIDRDGRLAYYHSGVVPDMVKTVRSEVLELLK